MRSTLIVLMFLSLPLTAQTDRSAQSDQKERKVKIRTNAPLIVQEDEKGLTVITVKFPGGEGAKKLPKDKKDFTLNAPYKLEVLGGGVRENVSDTDALVEVFSIDELKAAGSDLSREGRSPCQFVNSAGFKYCRDPSCPQYPGFKCKLFASNNNCACIRPDGGPCSTLD